MKLSPQNYDKENKYFNTKRTMTGCKLLIRKFP